MNHTSFRFELLAVRNKRIHIFWTLWFESFSRGKNVWIEDALLKQAPLQNSELRFQLLKRLNSVYYETPCLQLYLFLVKR